MRKMLFSGRSNRPLAQRLAATCGLEPGPVRIESFPDGELRVELETDVRDLDLYLLQSTNAPVAEHLMELLLLADACRRAGAARITAILPYFGYARQDRRARGREPVSARVVADLLSSAADRIVAVDLHSPALEGFFSVPLEHLSAVPLLAEAFRPARAADQVLVAPDHGAVKLVHRYGQLLDLPVATVHKVRRSGSQVHAHGVTGTVKNKTPVVIDDMIATGGTLVAAIGAVLEAGARPEVTVITSHALLVGTAAERLRDLPLRAIIASDSVAGQDDPDLPLRRVSLAGPLAEAVARLAGGTGPHQP